jgi:glutaredoxin-related protein
MLIVYDKDEDIMKSIKEINDDILVFDQSSYFEKSTNKKFVTIPKKAKLTGLWKEFWTIKMNNN